MRVTLIRDPGLSSRDRGFVTSARLGALLRRAGDQLGVASRAGITLRLTGDGELHALNARYRNVDEPTDVLAFEGSSDHVGDIAISVERARRQRADAAAELRLLAVHGLLHCLGHDHADPAQAARMTAETRRLLPGEDVPELHA